MGRREDHWELVADYMISGQAAFYRMAYGYVKDREAALDIVQEAAAKRWPRPTLCGSRLICGPGFTGS